MKSTKCVLLVAGLSLAMAFALFACSSDSSNDQGENNNNSGEHDQSGNNNGSSSSPASGIFGYCDYGPLFTSSNGEVTGGCYPMDTDDDRTNCSKWGNVVTSCGLSSNSVTQSSSSNPKCGDVVYIPSIEFCSGTTVYLKCGGETTYVPETEECCGINKFTTASQFCSGARVYSKCGGTLIYSPGTEQCCGSNKYTTATQFCSGTTVYSKCDGKEYNPAIQECVNNIVYGYIVDSRDSKRYKTVEIGTQTWMAENLSYVTLDAIISLGQMSKCPGDVAANCTKYGRQYNWRTAMGLTYLCGVSSICDVPVGKNQGICPDGWHIPSQAEWNELIGNAGGNPGTKLKSKTGWNSGNGTDERGFNALPGGYTSSTGTGNSIGDIGLWWTATQYNSSYAYDFALTAGSDVVKLGEQSYDYSISRENLLSVRCIKD